MTSRMGLGDNERSLQLNLLNETGKSMDHKVKYFGSCKPPLNEPGVTFTDGE